MSTGDATGEKPKQITTTTLIQDFFGEPGGGRKVTMEEFLALRSEERTELAVLIAKEKGIDYVALGCRAMFLRPVDPFGWMDKTGHRVEYPLPKKENAPSA